MRSFSRSSSPASRNPATSRAGGRPLFLALLLVLLLAPAAPAAAQWRAAPLFPQSAGYLERAGPFAPPTDSAGAVAAGDRCRFERPAAILGGAAGGAALGWLMFSVTVGAMAGGHDAEYRRLRTGWVVAGAAVGAVIGAVLPGRCRSR